MRSSSRNQRNELCPCKSGRKFKHCCLRKIQQLEVPIAVPVLSLPFSIHTLTEIISQNGKTSRGYDFAPLLCIGENYAAVNFEKTSLTIQPNQIVRFGFCNDEARPVVQIRTDRGTFELVCQEVVSDGTHDFIVTFDNVGQRMRLFVDGQVRGEAALRGQFDFSSISTLIFGFGGAPFWYGKVLRNTCDFSDVSGTGVIRPDDLSSWNHYPGGIDRLFQPSEHERYAYCWISRHFLRAMSTEKTFEETIIRLNGRDVRDFASHEAMQVEAHRTLQDVTERLRSIVEDTSSGEPALLEFFKTNPAAVVLLEPDTVRQWREAAIQDYGQIDFVLELVDGTFRVVEIESATKEVFTAKNEFSQPTQHAIEQTRKWIRGASKAPNAVVKRYGRFVPEAFLSSVVIGRTAMLKNDFCREVWHDSKRTLKLETWDDVVHRGEILVQRLNNPSVSDSGWDSD